MMQKFLHFTITSDARRQIPKMILERLVDEYLWQELESTKGSISVKERATRVRQLIDVEIGRRKAQNEFEKLMIRAALTNSQQIG